MLTTVTNLAIAGFALFYLVFFVRRWRQFYGWRIVLATFLTITVSNGMTLGGLQVFDAKLLEELGLERGVLKDRDAIILIVSAALAPVAGSLADRFGVRPLMLLGAFVLAGSMYAYSRIDSIGDLRLVSMLAGASLAGVGLVICVTIVSRWFVAHRGLALGLMLGGTSLGNAFFPKLNAFLIEHWSWREAFVALALIPLLLVPVVLLLVREWPRDHGLEPLGAAGATPPPPAAGAWDDLFAALRSPNFWLLAAIAFGTFYSILGVSSNIFLHLTDLGLGPAEAASSFAYLFLLGLVGKVISGWLAERYGRKRVFVVLLLTMGSGALLMLPMTVTLVWPALVLIGLGWGGLYTLLQLLTAEIFGTRSLGKILGTLIVIDALGGALGQKATGTLFDVTGSYFVSFAVIAGLIGIATLAALLLRIPQRPLA